MGVRQLSVRLILSWQYTTKRTHARTTHARTHNTHAHNTHARTHAQQNASTHVQQTDTHARTYNFSYGDLFNNWEKTGNNNNNNNNNTNYIIALTEIPLALSIATSNLTTLKTTHLIFTDFPHCKVGRLGMSEVDSWHRGGRFHGQRLSQTDSCESLAIHHLPHGHLLQVVGLAGVAWGGPDSLGMSCVIHIKFPQGLQNVLVMISKCTYQPVT